ncbi:transposase family protein [Hymenobacter sp. BT664]|uniref:Transposase family protein n=1 Tax=Hymenobacter montanus TaxID=2771359 RepID=A0A927BE40_9BACT|nr:DDE-type integrase/transposase/recombinase [Hymenobacter montanus]MBD2768423.1 transposase family protein [Hymenobacter montanus]
MAAEQKLQRIDALLQRHQVTTAQLSEDRQQLKQLRLATEQQAGEALFHEALAAASLRLQTKLGALVKALVVDEATTRADLWRATHYYQQHDGHLSAQVPLDFLSFTQRAYVLDAQGRLRPSLYKALLFMEMATAIKSGQLSFTCCYQYRAFQANHVWVSDITYLPLANGSWAYLCAFWDVASKHVVGWHVMATMTEELVTTALQRGFWAQPPAPELCRALGPRRAVLRHRLPRPVAPKRGRAFADPRQPPGHRFAGRPSPGAGPARAAARARRGRVGPAAGPPPR